MRPRAESPLSLFAEIAERGTRWRTEHLDLPATLVFLSRVKRALPGLASEPDAKSLWSGLKTAGKSFARRRALFVAAEAAGCLRGHAQSAQRETITSALGVVVDEGATLDKVRALRALGFIRSDDCIPILKKGLQDRSAWVQVTALKILLGMNLRQSAPRKVLTDFLTDRFEGPEQPEQAFDPRAMAERLQVDMRLLVALMKVPGGGRLAPFYLRLWSVSAATKILHRLRKIGNAAVTGLDRALTAMFRLLGFLLLAVFFKFPLLILSRPELLLRVPVVLGQILAGTARVIYRLLIWPTYQVATAPLWARRIERSFAGLRDWRALLTLLDYASVGLIIAALRPRGIVSVAVAVGAYFVLLAASVGLEEEDGKLAERFRLFNRCLIAALVAWYAGGAVSGGTPAFALTVLAGTQCLWLLPAFARALGKVASLIAVDLERRRQRRLERAEPTWLKRQLEKVPTRERLAVEVPVLIERSFRSAWPVVGPRLLRLARGLVVVILLIAAARYILSLPATVSWAFNMSGELSRTELRPLAAALTHVLYVCAGGLLVAILSALCLASFRILWDELWIVERIALRTRSQNARKFKGGEFFAYIFQLVRDETLSTGLRVRAASALERLPLVSRSYVDQLEDLADEEGLPSAVVDAVSKVADEAEKRLTRRRLPEASAGQEAQHVEFKVDMSLVNQDLKDIWKPGEALRPWIRKGLAGVLLIACIVAVWLWPAHQLTDRISLVFLAVGSALVVLYMGSARRGSKWVKWSLLAGVILLVSVFTRPLQIPLYEMTGVGNFRNGLVAQVEASSFSVLVLPVLVAGIVAQLAHTLYLLGCDADVAVKMEGKLNVLRRRLKRLSRQESVVRPVTCCALFAVLLQSPSFQAYVHQRDEQVPTFTVVRTTSEVGLQGIPIDGRVMRVALVRAGAADVAVQTLGDLKSLSQEERSAVADRSLKDAGLFPLDANDVWGDVWFAAMDGRVRWWATSPIRCLEPSMVNGDFATFDLHALCDYDDKVRLVAILYERQRSEFIKSLPRQQPRRGDVREVYGDDYGLLLDTISPFVRATWSPVY